MTYDWHGNRRSRPYTQGTGTNQSFSYNPPNNENFSYTYNAAGNQMNEGIHSYTYDPEGNVTEVDNGGTSNYSYDPLNRRTQVGVGSSYHLDIFDADGHRAKVFDGNRGALLSTNVYWGDRLVATYKGGQVFYQHADVHGTVRATTNSSGATVGSFSSLPFGDNYNPSGTDVDPLHFSELDHDASSGTEHAQFRQYSSALGRWMSPDPYSGSYHWRNPQSLDRYLFALNNPLLSLDPSGLIAGSDEECGAEFQPPCRPAYNDGVTGGGPLSGYGSISSGFNDEFNTTELVCAEKGCIPTAWVIGPR